MAEIEYPGVDVEEVPLGVAPIAGVETSTTGFIGAQVINVRLGTLRRQIWSVRRTGRDLRFGPETRGTRGSNTSDEILGSTDGQWRFISWDALDKSKYSHMQLATFRTVLSRPQHA